MMSSMHVLSCCCSRKHVVVAGGRVVTRLCTFQTYYCANCRKLMDLMIGEVRGSNLGLLPACPKCGPGHLRPWYLGERCPSCGATFYDHGVCRCSLSKGRPLCFLIGARFRHRDRGWCDLIE